MSWAAMRQALWPQLDGRSERQIDAELDEEFAFHLAMLQREGCEQGLEPAAARELALARFGDHVRIRNECRRIELEERIMLQRIHLAFTILLVLIVAVTTFTSVRMYRQAAQAREAATVEMVAARANSVAAETERQRAETMQKLIEKVLTAPPKEPGVSLLEMLSWAERRVTEEFADQPELAAQVNMAIQKVRRERESDQSAKPMAGTVFVWGLVKRTGAFNLDPDDRLTLRRVLDAAGAPTSRPAVVDVDRFGEDRGRYAARLTFREDGSVEGEDLTLQGNDMIYVRDASPKAQPAPE